MRAVRKQTVGIVRKLIQHGANMKLTNKVAALHAWFDMYILKMLSYHSYPKCMHLQ